MQMANKNEILKQYFTDKEIKDLKENKPDKYTELLEKLKLSENKTQVELDKLKHELENLSLDEKIGKVLNLVENSDKNQKPTKEQEEKAKKEAEEKWFSWEKISKIVEEKGGWFSWAWISAWVWAIFTHYIWDFFSDLFWKAKEWVDGLVDSVKEWITWESEWTFEKWIYRSKEKKLEISFNNDNSVKEILINNNKYVIPEWYKLEDKDDKKCLVWGWKLSNNVFALDYLWKYFDSQEDKVIYSIDENTNKTSIIDNISGDLFKWEIEFKKEDSLEKIENNILTSWNTKIYFNENIDKNKNEQKLKIEKIVINWVEYNLHSNWEDRLEFSLIKKDNNYYLDYWISTKEIKISEIETFVNKDWYKIDDNAFSMYRLIDTDNKILDNIKNFLNWEAFEWKLWEPIIALKKL